LFESRGEGAHAAVETVLKQLVLIVAPLFEHGALDLLPIAEFSKALIDSSFDGFVDIDHDADTTPISSTMAVGMPIFKIFMT